MNRKLRLAVTRSINVVVVSFLATIIARSPVSAESDRQTHQPNKEAVLKYLRPALNSAKKTARFYYFDVCSDNDPYRLRFPRISVQPVPKNKEGLQAIRQIFKGDRAVTVTEVGDDIIRVNVAKTQSPILQTKIRLLRFTAEERYTPLLAVRAIKNSNEVQTVAAKLGLREPVIVWSLHIQEPMQGLPHLPASLKDITMDQALDAVAKTFGVIVVFGECTSPSGNHLFRVDVERLH